MNVNIIITAPNELPLETAMLQTATVLAFGLNNETLVSPIDAA
jgi:hypothetical protein